MGELNVFLFITNICLVLLYGVFLSIAPMLTRKSFLFGVKVPPEAQDTDEAKALKRGYIMFTIIGATIVLAASVLQYIAVPNDTVYAVMVFPLTMIAIRFAAFAPNHDKVRNPANLNSESDII
jgi:hypothetical protein